MSLDLLVLSNRRTLRLSVECNFLNLNTFNSKRKEMPDIFEYINP
jgi:hypothetical protein